VLSQDLLDLDEEFRETHLALLKRFYKMFESIYRYVADFATYLEEMQQGVFLQHSVDVSGECFDAACSFSWLLVQGVLMDVEGRQLMCEALYLYGVMLLLMDVRIEGSTRERMIVSYIRYKVRCADDFGLLLTAD
jgi:WASH complex subunit strumpellin